MKDEAGKGNNVARYVLDKCGGARVVADWLGIHESIVYKWTYENGRSSDGLIPAKYQQPLLLEAHAHGIDLDPSDFFKTFPEPAE